MHSQITLLFRKLFGQGLFSEHSKYGVPNVRCKCKEKFTNRELELCTRNLVLGKHENGHENITVCQLHLILGNQSEH